jgi:hypothetical protein
VVKRGVAHVVRRDVKIMNVRKRKSIYSTLRIILRNTLLLNSLVFITLYYILSLRVYFLLIDIIAFVNILLYFILYITDEDKNENIFVIFMNKLLTILMLLYLPIILYLFFDFYYLKL